MSLVTTTATHIFFNITNIFQLNNNNLAALQAAKTAKCNQCAVKMSRKQCHDVENNIDKYENR